MSAVLVEKDCLSRQADFFQSCRDTVGGLRLYTIDAKNTVWASKVLDLPEAWRAEWYHSAVAGAMLSAESARCSSRSVKSLDQTIPTTDYDPSSFYSPHHTHTHTPSQRYTNKRVERVEWKCENGKCATVKNAGVDNTRQKNAGPICKGGKCRTIKCVTLVCEKKVYESRTIAVQIWP